MGAAKPSVNLAVGLWQSWAGVPSPDWRRLIPSALTRSLQLLSRSFQFLFCQISLLEISF